MITGLLPIGTVVLLKESTKRVMIIGLIQKQIGSGKVWDYAGVLYPEGYMGSEKTFLFNGDMIDKVFAIGYQDDEQFEFKDRADKTLIELRMEEEKAMEQ